MRSLEAGQFDELDLLGKSVADARVRGRAFRAAPREDEVRGCFSNAPCVATARLPWNSIATPRASRARGRQLRSGLARCAGRTVATRARMRELATPRSFAGGSSCPLPDAADDQGRVRPVRPMRRSMRPQDRSCPALVDGDGLTVEQMAAKLTAAPPGASLPKSVHKSARQRPISEHDQEGERTRRMLSRPKCTRVEDALDHRGSVGGGHQNGGCRGRAS